jgi:hypothetical protein
MPAIQLSRLRLQAAHLRDSFTRPEAFARGLQAMLDFYADRTHRPGQAGEPPPLIPAYHVPPPVLRQVLLELKPLIEKDADHALLLSDTLWAQSNLECCTLAASILGLLPPSQAEKILDRVTSWARALKEEQLLEILLDEGLQNFRREQPDHFLSQVETWLASENPRERSLGLKALKPLIEEGAHENLPSLFRLLTPLAWSIPPALRSDLLEVLRAAARNSPRETTYFLRQTLASPHSLDTPWLARQILPELTPETRQSLREALRQIGKVT